MGRERSGSVQSDSPGIGAAGGAECRLVPERDEVAVVGGTDEEHREGAELVDEDDDLVAVAVGLPRDGVDQRTEARAGVQLVLPVDVGDPADTARGRLRAQGAGDPARPTRGVEDEVSR